MEFEYSDIKALPVVKRGRGLECGPHTEVLDLSKLDLSDPSALSKFAHLVEINLSHNPLLSFSNDEEWRFHLKSLNLSHCQIKNISNFSTPLLYLIELNISHNEISSLECIRHCKYLRTLDASNNNITEIGHLDALSNLQTLHLNSNSITSISALSGLNCLKEVILSENQISDITSLLSLKAMHALKLDSNQIPDLTQVKALSSNLMDLMIENNPCCEIENYENEIIKASRCLRVLNAEAITPERLVSVWEGHGDFSQAFEAIEHYWHSKCDPGRRNFFIPKSESSWTSMAEAGLSVPWEGFIQKFIESKPTSLRLDNTTLRALSDCLSYPIETNIESIHIENKAETSEVTGLGLRLFLERVPELSALTELTLNGCGIGRSAQQMPSPLSAPNLVKLNLRDNFLGTHIVQRNDDGHEFIVEPCPLFRKFVKDMIGHETLQELDLSLNGLDCRASEALASLLALEQHPLRLLDLSTNSLADTSSQSAWQLMKLLSTNAWLTQLSIRDVFVKEENRPCVEQLWVSLQENKALLGLDVSGNVFSAKFFKRAFEQGQCVLTTLIAQRCNLGLEEFNTIVSVLTNFPRQLHSVSLKENRINTKLLNSVLGAAANNLSRIEVDTPEFVNTYEDLSNFGNVLASPGLSCLMLQGWVSFKGVSISSPLSSLGVTTVLSIGDLGLDPQVMSQVITAVASSGTLEALMIGGNAFDFNTWDALHTAFDIDNLKNLRQLSLQGVQIVSAECFEMLGLVLKSTVVEKRLNVLDMSDIEWPVELDELFWECLPTTPPVEPTAKENFVLKMNRITTSPDFDVFVDFMRFLQVTELHWDDSSFVLDAFEGSVNCVVGYEDLTHLSARTSAPISASNEAVLMLCACHKLQALRLPAFLQDHILEDIFVLAEEHQSLCTLETQYDSLQKQMEGLQPFWTSLRCSMATRSLVLGKAQFENFTDYKIRLEQSPEVDTPASMSSSDV